MSKIEVNKVADILRRSLTDPAEMRRVIEEIEKEIENRREASAEAPPAQKKQFVILISDPDGEMPETDLAGWVVQLPEDASPLSTVERIAKAAYDFNASRAGRKLPVATIPEALECVATKFFKEVDVAVKTKVPVQVLRTDNKLPRA